MSSKSISVSSVPSMVIAFVGSGSGAGVPEGCALSFCADRPEGFGARPAAGGLGFRARVVAEGWILGFGGALLDGVFLKGVPLVAAGLSVDVWAVLGVRFDLVFMAEACC